MRKECAGCGAILPEDVQSCPICGNTEFKETRVSTIQKPARVQSSQAPERKGDDVSLSQAKVIEPSATSGQPPDETKRQEMEQFFMETITQLILGGVAEPGLERPVESALKGAEDEGASKYNLMIHEILLFREDKTEILRKKYGTEVCSGIEVMRIRDFLSSSEYRPGEMIYLDEEKRLVIFGSSSLIFVLRVSGSLHPQSDFVIKKVAEVGSSRISGQSQEVSKEHLLQMMEKLCDALHSALMKLAG